MRQLDELPDYKLLKHLGTGAHAVIALAAHIRTGEKVAIKTIIRRDASDDRFLAQAETEFRIASRLNHPALRRCLDIVRVRKWLMTTRLILIMEYAPGDTLEQHPPSRLTRVPQLFVAVAEGLHAMHKAGFIHADIKPNNIILGPHAQVKIIDFGQSCELGHRKERIQGTPDYIAPEQVLRHPLDQRTDVFNLGATLYWVLTRRAFSTLLPARRQGDKLIDLRSERENPPPHELNPRVPLPLSRLVMRCCESDPGRRCRDMREVIAGLELADHLMHKSAERSEAPSAHGGTPRSDGMAHGRRTP